MSKALEDFLNVFTLEDIENPVIGELNEFSTDDNSYFFGNGELIVSPIDESQSETVYCIETVGFIKHLVEC